MYAIFINIRIVEIGLALFKSDKIVLLHSNKISVNALTIYFINSSAS